MTHIKLAQKYLNAVNDHFSLGFTHSFQVTHSTGYGYNIVRMTGPSGSESTLAGSMTMKETYYYARGIYEGLVGIARGDGVYQDLAAAQHGLVTLNERS
jgi:hypothetical protein